MKTFTTVAPETSSATLATETNFAMNTIVGNPATSRDNRNCQLAIRLILIAIAHLGLFTVTAKGQNIQNSKNTSNSEVSLTARVDPASLGMNFTLQLGSYPGRGATVPVILRYSSKVWHLEYQDSYLSGSPPAPISSISPQFQDGWSTSIDPPTLEGSDKAYNENGEPVDLNDTNQWEYNDPYWQVARIYIHMPGGTTHELLKDGTIHEMRYGRTDNPNIFTGDFYSIDSSGLRFNFSDHTLYMPDGSRFITPSNGVVFTTFIDPSGNKSILEFDDYTDTLGRDLNNPLYNVPTAAQNINYSLPGLGSGTQDYVLKWKELEDSLTVGGDLNYLGDCADLTPALFQSDSTNDVCGPSSLFNPIVLNEIVLPGGTSYVFTYNVYGEIDKIVYPTGAYERFQYDIVYGTSYLSGPYDQGNRGVTDRWISESGSSSDEIHWDYASSTYGLTTVTAPDGSYAVKSFQPATYAGGYGFESQGTGNPAGEKIYDSGDNLLRRTLYEYQVDGPYSREFDPRVTHQISIVFENGATSALATMEKTEYATPGSGGAPSDWSYFAKLNATKTTSYKYLAVALSTAQSGSLTTIKNLFTSSGEIDRTTETDFLYDSNYLARGIRALPTETRVKNAAGNVKARTQVEYDDTDFDLASSGTMPSPASGSWVDPEGSGEFGATIGNKRGRVTTVKRYYDISNGHYIETRTFYDQFGNVRKVRDGNGNETESLYDYDYAFAYPTSVITPVPDAYGTYGSSTALTSSIVYDYKTGLPTETTDANGQLTEMEYDDPLLRPTKVVEPSGAETNTEYGAGTSPSTRWVKVVSDLDTTNTKYAYTWFDGLGRPWLSQTEDSAGDVFAVTCYDDMGRVSKTSNPFRNVSNPTCSSSLEWTTPVYDDLGRTITVTTPDSAVVETTYGLATSGSQIGTVMTVEDQADKARRLITNVLGQLTRVDEPNSSGLGSIASPYQPTLYAYDTLGNLIEVEQDGDNTDECVGASTCSRDRTFVYDALSRLKEANNPEAGTVKYTYDANGNLKTKWDARGIKTIYDYDTINRIWKTCYKSVGTSSLGYTTCTTASSETAEANTPDVTYYYDNATNAKGNLTKVASSVSTTEYLAFDILGRVTRSKQTTDGVEYGGGSDPTKWMTYTYNLSGALVEQQYPSGRVVKNTFDAADGSLSQVQSKRSSETYRNFANGFIYNSAGAVTAMRLGNGKWENTVFNSRMQPTQIGLGNGVNSQNLLKLQYSYGTTANNGNVVSHTITVPGVAHPLVQTYTYDELDRVTNAEEIKNSVQQWEQTFTYDRYGNRNFNEAETTTLPKNCGTTPNFTVCAPDKKVVNPAIDVTNNRLDEDDDYDYDAVGNMIEDAEERTFVYDAENKQIKVIQSSVTIGEYFYDGDGKRIKKRVPAVGDTPEEITIFVYDASGKLIQEFSTIVQNAEDAETVYTTNDALGSPRINTDTTGQVISRHDYHPFGEEVDRSALGYGSDTIRKQFTGYERDGETGLDFAQARYFSSQQGRFASPDPLFFQDTMPIDPQRFNLYGYARNNPHKWVDPTGERLHLRGDTGWLRMNVLYEMAGGQEQFEKYFDIVSGEVIARPGVDSTKANEGIKELLALVGAAENYVYFAGGNNDADSAVRLLQGTTDRRGRLTSEGRLLKDKYLGLEFPGGRFFSTSGREGYLEPTGLPGGDPVFAVIAWNYEYDQSEPYEQYDVDDDAFSQASRETQESGLNQVVKPVSIFMHESAENRSFATMKPSQRGANYRIAHKFAIYREALIRKSLKITGGFAGGKVRRRRE